MKKIVYSLLFLLGSCGQKKIPLQPQEVKPPIIQEEKKLKKELKIEKKSTVVKKFQFEEEDLQSLDKEKIPIAIILDEKKEPSSLVEGAHLAINDLYNERGVEIEITRIDLGSKLEDLELSLKPLETKPFKMILTDLDAEKEAFIEPFLSNSKSVNLGRCRVTLDEALEVILQKKSHFYLLLPEGVQAPHKPGVNVLFYSRDSNKAKIDLKQIAETLEDKVPIVLMENSWKSQHFLTNLEELGKKNPIILAPFLTNKLISDLEIKHKFGKVALVQIQDLNSSFIKNYYNSLKKKLDFLAWMSYDLVKNFDQKDKTCSINLYFT